MSVNLAVLTVRNAATAADRLGTRTTARVCGQVHEPPFAGQIANEIPTTSGSLGLHVEMHLFDRFDYKTGAFPSAESTPTLHRASKRNRRTLSIRIFCPVCLACGAALGRYGRSPNTRWGQLPNRSRRCKSIDLDSVRIRCSSAAPWPSNTARSTI